MLFDVVFCVDGEIGRVRVNHESAKNDNVLAPVYHSLLTMNIGDHLVLRHQYYIVRVG